MIFKKIQENYDSLSKTNKKIADYILNNYSDFAFLTLNELSEKLDISPASIYRFATKMGCDGFPELKNFIQEQIKKELIPMKELKDSIEDNPKKNDILYETINANVKTLKRLYSQDINSKFDKIVDKMNKANKIYIFALRSTFTTAYYFHFMLKQFMDNVILLELNHGDIYDDVKKLNGKDLYFTLSFSPYTQKSVEMLEFANSRGAYTIALSDSLSSPLLSRADMPVNIELGSRSYSFVSVLTFLNAVVVALGKEDKENTLKKLKYNEKYLLEQGVYFRREGD